MRISIDTDVLVYAMDSRTSGKQEIARRIMAQAPFRDVVLTAQALGEFLNVVRRKHPPFLADAKVQAALWAEMLPVVPTAWEDVGAAAESADTHRLQFWDSVIWQAARSAGAGLFLSEDMQDGLALGGMTVLNPFSPANADRLASLLGEAQ